MPHRMRVAASTIVAMALLLAGCAGPSSSGAPIAAAVVAASHLSGTWNGTFGQLSASLYEDEGRCILRIKEDGTFTATVTPNGGTNNLAKASTWAGTVVPDGQRVTLRNSTGPWPWIILTRSGSNTLYGVATDPATEAPVMMEFEREGTRS